MRRGRLHLRHRHAAGRRMRLGHALHRRRRQHPDGCRARRVHRRIGRRHGARAVLGGAAGIGAPSRSSRVYGVAALAASLTVFGASASLTVVVEKRRFGTGASELPATASALAARTLAARGRRAAAWRPSTSPRCVIAGRPWGVTSAFALWGAKVLRRSACRSRRGPTGHRRRRRRRCAASVFTDVTSVMDVGIVLGALLAALLAGRFAPMWRIPPRSLAAAVSAA